MFTEEMIAPCGLDCSLCIRAQAAENPCPGCLGPDEHKPEFCSTRCDIIQCRKQNGYTFRFCDECPEFPCARTQEREDRYASQYALAESPFENLAAIRKDGMERFLQAQRARWTCGDCGGVISVHSGVCGRCGRNYGQER